MKGENLMEKIISLAKRRGFIFPSSEIYGGFSSVYDYGPLGVEMKRNIKNLWWKEMTMEKDSIFGLDSAILMNPRIWQASGHLSSGFADELVECTECHKRFRIDETKNDKCPVCGGKLTKPRKFNLMMKTFVGAVEDKTSEAYLRPETCQGIFVNFDNVLKSQRAKIPFGIAQIGKSFRNEITPKNFIYRIREFEQMEMEWFCHPKDADRFFEFWKEERINWYVKLGIKREHLRVKKIPKSDLPHYALAGADIEYKFPFGWGELEALHNRGDWDLRNHSQWSGKDLKYFDETKREKYYPCVIETSAGVDRSFLAFLTEAFREIEGGRTKTTKVTKEKEIILSLDGRISPVKVAVLPLVKNNENIVKKARKIYSSLKKIFPAQYDEVGSIGRRYRRQDEIGTVFCIAVDHQTLEDNTVTVRERETMNQLRIKIEDLEEFIENSLENQDFKVFEKSDA